MNKVLYFSDSKFPLAGVAGAIHTGLLPMKGKSVTGEMWDLQFLNSKSRVDRIVCLGDDELGNRVYALSVKGEQDMVFRLIDSFLEIYNIPAQELVLVDSGFKDNLLLLVGRVLCRSRILTPLGRYLMSAGVKQSYAGLVRLVQDVKASRANLP